MFLEDIVSESRRQVEERKTRLPLDTLQRLASLQPPPLDFAAAIQGDSVKLIAEVKKASPSKGLIRPEFDPVEIARIYASNGAAAISVLTESSHFQGSLASLRAIKDALDGQPIPLLRKDFIIDPYQVCEARANGADCVLLIVAILGNGKLREMINATHDLGMACLVEVHNESELEIALENGAKIVGINNRDLKTFTTDLAVTERLRPLVPKGKIVISESGIKGRSDMERLKALGIHAALVGEALMASTDIAAKMKELLQ